MTIVYGVHVIHADRGAWRDALDAALAAEIKNLGLHQDVQVRLVSAPGEASVLSAVYLASNVGATRCEQDIRCALDRLVPVLPVVEDVTHYRAVAPPSLHGINGWEWNGPEPARRLARVLLEQLGIEERQRRVFISHRRDDGINAAEQLHDELSHRFFEPFIDRFAIPSGEDVQERIAEALEQYAFLLLLETPLAHDSPWVFYEVEYALSHSVGMHIVRWPAVVEAIPATAGLRRLQLDPADLVGAADRRTLTPECLNRVVAEVEELHAQAMVRRRRLVISSIADAASEAGCSCVPLPGGRLLVECEERRDIVGTATRLPTVEDLYRLDQAREELSQPASPVLVHAARRLGVHRRAVLQWATARRQMTLLPENAIGAYW